MQKSKIIKKSKHLDANAAGFSPVYRYLFEAYRNQKSIYYYKYMTLKCRKYTRGINCMSPSTILIIISSSISIVILRYNYNIKSCCANIFFFFCSFILKHFVKNVPIFVRTKRCWRCVVE